MAEYNLDNEDGSIATISKDGNIIKYLAPSFSVSGQVAENGISIYLASHNWSYLFVTDGNTFIINGEPVSGDDKDALLRLILTTVFLNTISGTGGTGSTDMDDMIQGTTKKYVTPTMYNFITSQMAVDNP